MCFVESIQLDIISLFGVGIFDVLRQFILKVITDIPGFKLTILVNIGVPICKITLRSLRQEYHEFWARLWYLARPYFKIHITFPAKFSHLVKHFLFIIFVLVISYSQYIFTFLHYVFKYFFCPVLLSYVHIKYIYIAFPLHIFLFFYFLMFSYYI